MKRPFRIRDFSVLRGLSRSALESQSIHRQRLFGISTTTTSSTPAVQPNPSTDFNHHHPTVSRLNHASFGATPAPVLVVQSAFRKAWLEQPDEWYFSGKLHESIRKAALSAATTLVPKDGPMLQANHVCLVENATVAACALAYRWSKLIRPGDVIVYLDLAYKSCIHILKEYCESVGATLVPIKIPFLATSREEILHSVRKQMIQLDETHRRPRFAFLDHVSSQPAVLLPITEMIQIVREYGCEDMEVCVDGAHAVGSVSNLDITTMGCDFYFSNLHKWGFAPATATVFWSEKLPEMRHPIVSWAWGQGLSEESLFPGTRDFSAFMAVTAAVEYLDKWEMKGQNSQVYCHDRVVEAAAWLRRDWGVEHLSPNGAMEDSLIATQAMVRLPEELVVTDAPGQVSRGVRDVLREDYEIEAAVGNFGEERGAYVRLSWAVYNSNEDIQRLSSAIIDIIENQ